MVSMSKYNALFSRHDYIQVGSSFIVILSKSCVCSPNVFRYISYTKLLISINLSGYGCSLIETSLFPVEVLECRYFFH